MTTENVDLRRDQALHRSPGAFLKGAIQREYGDILDLGGASPVRVPGDEKQVEIECVVSVDTPCCKRRPKPKPKPKPPKKKK